MHIALTSLEVGLQALAICGTVLLWARPQLLDWTGVAANIGRALILSLSCTLSFYFTELYDLRKVRSFEQFSARLPKSLGVSLILTVVFYMLLPELRLTKGPFTSSLLVLVGVMVPLRGALYAIMQARASREQVLIVGTSPLGWKIVAETEAAPHLGYSVMGFVDDGESSPLEPSPHELYPLLGPPEDLWKTIEELRPDRVVVVVGERPGRLSLPQLLKTKWSGIVVEEGTEIYERLAKKLPIESLTPSRIIASRDFGKLGWLTAAQRALSLTVAALGLLLTWPLMAIIALLIKLDSKGPVFFIQKRMGRRERVFRLIKFRTMHPTSNETTEWVRDNSNRITRIGKWLRKSRLDELPQFVNILLGDMKLVGPRPHPVSNLELFVEKIPYYSLRHMVRPGITGWAQVRYGYANNLDEETEKTRYDLYYIKHLSLWFDLRILFETVRIVLFRPGSKEAFALRAPNLAGASRR